MLDSFTRLLAAIAGVFMVLMVIHITADIFMKLVFSAPIEGTTELVSYWYMVGAMFLAMGLIQRQNRHIAADVITQLMNPRLVYATETFNAFLMAVYAGVFTWQMGLQAYEETLRLEKVQAADFYVIVYPARWFLPLGFGLMTLYAALQFFRSLRSRSVNHRP